MTARFTRDEAATVARVTRREIDQALDSGELRSLAREDVDAWSRARVAAIVARSQG